MIYPVVDQLAADGIPVAVTCRVLQVSTSGFYEWQSRPASVRDWDQAHLMNPIRDVHAAAHGTYGHRRVHAEPSGQTGPLHFARTLTPQQAAYPATAQLRLPRNPPGIGPPPSINRWNVAVVGYPLWLWSDGPTHLGPVTKTVLDAPVSLEADLTQITFRMGDGSLVRCTGAGTLWTPQVTPGAASASCGYR